MVLYITLHAFSLCTQSSNNVFYFFTFTTKIGLDNNRLPQFSHDIYIYFVLMFILSWKISNMHLSGIIISILPTVKRQMNVSKILQDICISFKNWVITIIYFNVPNDKVPKYYLLRNFNYFVSFRNFHRYHYYSFLFILHVIYKIILGLIMKMNHSYLIDYDYDYCYYFD